METKHLDIIMNEMCKRVGTTWDKINPKEKKWYTKYTWSPDEEYEFKEWMVDYLYNNSEARAEILTSGKTRLNKTILRRTVSWFLLDYAWSIKPDTQ